VKKVLILSSTIAMMLFAGCAVEVVDTPKAKLVKAPVTKQVTKKEVTSKITCNECQDDVVEEKVEVVEPICPKATKIVRYVNSCKGSMCGFPVSVRDEAVCKKGEK